MSLAPVRSDMYTPNVGKEFAASAAFVLHVEVALGGNAPASINHLPAGVIFGGVGNFVWKDALGNTVTTIVAAVASGGVVGVFVPIAPAEVTAANAVPFTALWSAGP